MTSIEKLESLGLALAPPAAPAANYVSVSRAGPLLYVSGQISAGPDGVITGTLGADLATADGQKAAARCAVAILSQIVHTAGVDLDGPLRMVKLMVLVASTPDFTEAHLVANGASDLLVEVLGERGRHARSAFGVASLPRGAAVEIEAIAEVGA